MILVADSGSTKTHWKAGEFSFQTPGFNPNFWDSASILREIRASVPSGRASEVKQVYFYGAGCSTLKNKNIIGLALKQVFRKAKINVQHDLQGAAKALFGKESGVAVIIGTGSNSCLYDGKKVLEQRGGQGYILSDEGSGAVLGRELLALYLADLLPSPIQKKLLDRFKLTSQKVIAGVYHKNHPNRFLASFVPFIHKHRKEPAIANLIQQSFDTLFVRHLTRYSGYKKLTFRCVGSVAHFFKDELMVSAKRHKITIDKIIKDPAEALYKIHAQEKIK